MLLNRQVPSAQLTVSSCLPFSLNESFNVSLLLAEMTTMAFLF